MHRDVIANRICFDREKIREQAKHYQKLLEVKASLSIRPPKPKKKNDRSISQSNITKKDRLKIDQNVQIQQENRILLKKMLLIDIKHSALAKQNMVPMTFYKRSSSSQKMRPSTSLNIVNRIEDLRKINDDNKLILKKLQDIKPSIDRKKFKDDNKSRQYQIEMMSKHAGRFQKHPFFVNEGKPNNLAANIYQEALKVQNSSQKVRKKKRPITGFDLYRKTMEAQGEKTFMSKRESLKSSTLKNNSLVYQDQTVKRAKHQKHHSQYGSISHTESDGYGGGLNNLNQVNYKTMYNTSVTDLPNGNEKESTQDPQQ